jgi:bacillithiol system protein YtxJ
MVTLADPAAVDAFLAGPGPRWILKHSSICPISDAAFREMEAFLAERPGETVGLVVVQDHRPASDHAARVLGVRHETPQAFLLLDRRVLWHGSHGRITRLSLAAAREGAREAGTPSRG